MPTDKKTKLDKVISTIQKRWGIEAIGRSSAQLPTKTPCIPTGFPDLDAAIGYGGIPRGRISELVGAPTSGMTTLALTITAAAQEAGGMAAYIDLQRNFDPAYAVQFGVLLDRLTLVHPFSAGQALQMLPDFVRNRGFSLLIWDMPAYLQQEDRVGRKLTSTLGRILAPLNKSNLTLLFVTTFLTNKSGAQESAADYPPQAILPHFATLRLLLYRERWLYRQRDINGYDTQVLILKNKLSAPGKTARIAIHFNDAHEGAG